MKTLKIPFIENLEKMPYEDLDMALETGGAKSFIGEVCWPDRFPYHPDTSFAIARSRTHIAVLYHIRCLDLRAMALEDNGPVWEDSCCEFFASDPHDGTYYNFEMNCIGTLLGAKRRNREDCTHYPPERLADVTRYSTLARKQRDLSGKIFGWSVGMAVPLEMIGIDPSHLPSSIRANFYKCADKTAHPHFLAWNRVVSPTPDFHRPDFFGELLF
ncbi:MAG: hypothetical protein IAB75_03000 [Bacteroidetes bacterium]|uniref:Carbohydrate-binding domain-containing protein n=1 Tax=Candidatus Cryptobacteroides avicola TaxID=2840757 RepID=A0A940IHU4_9BACT|nr:hypothetical protein [Candidatus Cryptobacteroides avicola]